MRQLLKLLIRAYRYLISPLMANHCRYYPSCSEYAETAIARYGAMKGGWLALRRLLRCHPGYPGGYDPVPGTESDVCSSPTGDCTHTKSHSHRTMY
jgi:uncharacterized protein